ncbi:hypothetical protein M3M39_06365 [Fructilactobacillus hinvesii]|uniref:Uncharacterized protein n=1 Tax=Fructilactobacillus hinvesii TaxID=2940300 RepID=A0ABY5BUQ0_9LACO|nr:hypothetical protein [Fructilactobacillus hinvesii]USS87726.1 hypothetical protein M3M39_06365 [Fructilactobacillus hinvesii]
MATSQLFKRLSKQREGYISSDELETILDLSHPALLQLVRRHAKELKNVSRDILHFRYDAQGRKVYLFNPAQATLLVVFMRSTGIVANFSTELVKLVFRIQRNNTKDTTTASVNKRLRKAVHKAGEDDYQKYFDLAYKVATGKNAKQLRKQLNIPSGKVITNFLSDKQIKRVNEVKLKIANRLASGYSYQEIRFSFDYLDQ